MSSATETLMDFIINFPSGGFRSRNEAGEKKQLDVFKPDNNQ